MKNGIWDDEASDGEKKRRKNGVYAACYTRFFASQAGGLGGGGGVGMGVGGSQMCDI